LLFHHYLRQGYESVSFWRIADEESAMSRWMSKWSPPDRPFDVTTHSYPDPEDVMRYLCLIYDDEKKVATMPESESNAFMGEYFAFTDGIRQSGHYLAGEALQPVETATTVRVRNGKVGTTDGPFAETKEQLGGFYMIEARDLNDAIQVAAKIPSARIGSVEVRPIVEFHKP
jgi:hypothetical protein